MLDTSDISSIIYDIKKPNKSSVSIYSTKAIDNMQDAIIVYYDKDNNYFTDEGCCLYNYGFYFDEELKNSDKLINLCSKIAGYYGCKFIDGKIICHYDKKQDELVRIVQAITAIQTMLNIEDGDYYDYYD